MPVEEDESDEEEEESEEKGLHKKNTPQYITRDILAYYQQH